MLLTFTILLSESSAGWWFSSDKQTSQENTNDLPVLKLVGAEFALDTLDNDEKAINLVENAKLQMRVSSKSCWLNAYGNLFVGCSKIVADQDLKDRLTWDLSDCFQKHSGRPPFPYCNLNYPIKSCLKELDDDEHKVFLQYFLQIDSICHQLQIHAFKDQTERLVNDLKKSAEYAETKLENIEHRGEKLLQNSQQIHTSLSSIDLQTQQVAKTSKNVHDNVNVLKKYSSEVYEQSKGIAASQLDLINGQKSMKEKLDEGMTMLHESYGNLGAEISNLKDETIEIEREIGKVGEEMFSKMSSLQSKADDIENLTGSSLDKQKQLLDSQSAALEGLRILTTFQSQALEESRGTLQKLSEFGKRQQEELLSRLCVAFLIELSILRCTTCDLENQAWLVTWTRSLFLLMASVQLLYAICTYRDYEVLNHQILLTLIDKVNGMQRNKELQWDMDEDSEINWSSWVEEELPEDVGLSEDPDYIFAEQVGENSIETSSIMKRYNLRNRHKYI
ncbi:hypothetical protein DH2020_038820 [Rehmannia glutinosa]|uniref:Protein GAMETE EXPRESSED 1 n=1 Tax=Rehmannia glutinosa TaxID=99300 RepID=A0ABR0UXZ5_REHGL